MASTLTFLAVAAIIIYLVSRDSRDKVSSAVSAIVAIGAASWVIGAFIQLAMYGSITEPPA